MMRIAVRGIKEKRGIIYKVASPAIWAGNGAEKEYILSGLLHEDERYTRQNLFDKRYVQKWMYGNVFIADAFHICFKQI